MTEGSAGTGLYNCDANFSKVLKPHEHVINLGHDHELLARQFELLNRLAEDHLREAIGVDLYTTSLIDHHRSKVDL